MCVLTSMIGIRRQITILRRAAIVWDTTSTNFSMRFKTSRVKSSSFFWSHWSHASNFFAPGIFVKQNSNRTVF